MATDKVISSDQSTITTQERLFIFKWSTTVYLRSMDFPQRTCSHAGTGQACSEHRPIPGGVSTCPASGPSRGGSAVTWPINWSQIGRWCVQLLICACWLASTAEGALRWSGKLMVFEPRCEVEFEEPCWKSDSCCVSVTKLDWPETLTRNWPLRFSVHR